FGNAQVWRTSGDEEAKLSMPGITIATFSPDGDHLLTGTMDGIARIWEVDSGNIALELTTLDEKNWVASTATGKVIHNDQLDARPLYWTVGGRIESFSVRQKDMLQTDLLQTVLKP
ncbi:MAG TPA: WD40 repeat domain-containing protein, partial [Rhodothermales bacterium]|nr:WD40 repeat domain-containing protein [Rhodothermales bacterium]